MLLNKGDAPTRLALGHHVQPGDWHSAFDPASPIVHIDKVSATNFDLGPHSVMVLLLESPVDLPWLRERLDRLMSRRSGG